MIIEELHLGMTRNCSLYCEHCLRGDKECVNIEFKTLDNLFKDVTGVKTLLLTGGEPLIAIQQLERLVEIIKSKGIKVGVIRIITNGTVMSSRVLKVLNDMKELAELDIKVSANIFHILELKRLGFLERRDRNFEILRDYFGAVWYGEETAKSEYNFKQSLIYKGRTKTLTKERLAEINDMVAMKYIIGSEHGLPENKGIRVEIVDDTILGQLTVNVNGDIVHYGLEYAEEDIESQQYGFNINKYGLMGALKGFIEVQNKEKEEESEILKMIFNK